MWRQRSIQLEKNRYPVGAYPICSRISSTVSTHPGPIYRVYLSPYLSWWFYKICDLGNPWRIVGNPHCNWRMDDAKRCRLPHGCLGIPRNGHRVGVYHLFVRCGQCNGKSTTSGTRFRPRLCLSDQYDHEPDLWAGHDGLP